MPETTWGLPADAPTRPQMLRRRPPGLVGRQSLDFLKQFPWSMFPGRRWSSSAADRYRLTEYCILSGHWYDVTGTCTENPNPRDEADRNLIVKGENESTFLISWRSEKEIERALRQRALLCVWGGAALAVVCVTLMLGKLGWL